VRIEDEVARLGVQLKRAAHPRAAMQRPDERLAVSQDSDAPKTATGLRLWREAHPIEGTTAEQCLRQLQVSRYPMAYLVACSVFNPPAGLIVVNIGA
jgi:hypothetical protein